MKASTRIVKNKIIKEYRALKMNNKPFNVSKTYQKNYLFKLKLLNILK